MTDTFQRGEPPIRVFLVDDHVPSPPARLGVESRTLAAVLATGAGNRPG